MEYVHGRPPMANAFRPPRQALNHDNEHLARVGLVVLIQGAPTQDLPRLMAEHLAAENGGLVTDYVISQATITPYIVSCPTIQTRNLIVQRGVYTILATQVRFAVYEWGPRFGMAYDPPSYQIWVRITGLPLQAWTTLEIMAFARRFGHPIQILPFGEAADHFRDITLLVDTNSLNSIPLAYTYREGDHSVQVDILILAWRVWENSYFPLPQGNPIPQPNAHDLPQMHDDHTISVNHSSSSSNDAPSEPTVDYSSWSPRSLSLQPQHTQQWQPKAIEPSKKTNDTINDAFCTLSPPESCYPPQIGNRFPDRLIGPQSHTLRVTENPSLLHDLQRTPTILQIYFPPAPSHICINSLFSPRLETSSQLKDRDQSTLRATGKPCVMSPFQITPHPQSKPLKTLDLAMGYRSPSQMVLLAIIMGFLKQTQSPKQPTSTALNNSHSIPLGPHNTPLPTPQAQHIDISPNSSLQSPQNISPSSLLNLSFSLQPTQLIATTDRLLPQWTNSDPTPQTAATPTQIKHIPSQSKKGKNKMPPTRRSQRLQEKRRFTDKRPSRAYQANTRTTELLFLSDTHELPLEVTSALAILQSTGLEVNKKIRDLIDEAANKDRPEDQTAQITLQPTSTTPLHDPIPPMAVPGFYLPL